MNPVLSADGVIGAVPVEFIGKLGVLYFAALGRKLELGKRKVGTHGQQRVTSRLMLGSQSLTSQVVP